MQPKYCPKPSYLPPANLLTPRILLPCLKKMYLGSPPELATSQRSLKTCAGEVSHSREGGHHHREKGEQRGSPLETHFVIHYDALIRQRVLTTRAALPWCHQRRKLTLNPKKGEGSCERTSREAIRCKSACRVQWISV